VLKIRDKPCRTINVDSAKKSGPNERPAPITPLTRRFFPQS
jgi:hypothetical protein